MRSEHAPFVSSSNKDKSLEGIESPELKSFLSSLHRDNAIIGNGSTADAKIFEDRFGVNLSKKGHTEKIENSIIHFQKLLKDPNLKSTERSIIAREIVELKNALNSKNPDYNNEKDLFD